MTQAITIKSLVDSPLVQSKLENVASKFIVPERLAQAMLLAVSRSRDLQDCSPMSLLDCLMVGAQYGWSIGGSRPGMYLVPYKGVATPIPSFYGLQDCARRSPDSWEIEAEVVRDGDDFVFEKGLNPVLKHKPHDDEEAPITHAYAIARSKDGRTKFEVMTVAAIEKVRASSRAKSGPWFDHYAEMCKKTVVRRLSKYLPASSEMDAALDLSDTVDRGEYVPQHIDVEPVKRKSLADYNDDQNTLAGSESVKAPGGRTFPTQPASNIATGTPAAGVSPQPAPVATSHTGAAGGSSATIDNAAPAKKTGAEPVAKSSLAGACVDDVAPSAPVSIPSPPPTPGAGGPTMSAPVGERKHEPSMGVAQAEAQVTPTAGEGGTTPSTTPPAPWGLCGCKGCVRPLGHDGLHMTIESPNLPIRERAIVYLLLPKDSK